MADLGSYIKTAEATSPGAPTSNWLNALLTMPLSWNEIKSRALTFSRTWADASQEDSQGKPF
jgi:hypothetical protein